MDQIVWTIWRQRRIRGIEVGRHVWNRYAFPPDRAIGFDENAFRSRIAQAVSVQYGPGSDDYSARECPYSPSELSRLAESLADKALFSQGWRTDSSDLVRYEAKLDRKLHKLLAELESTSASLPLHALQRRGKRTPGLERSNQECRG